MFELTANSTSVLYLVAGVLFIMSLRGLSSPESSRQGNVYGMIGMTIAVVVTLANLQNVQWEWIIGGVVVGGGIGLVIANRIAMTDMPQLVAAFHSLVGLAAVFVAAGAEAFHIVGADGNIFMASKIEMSLGIAIGAITFSGSVIAFLKLNGSMSGAPIMLPGRHLINALIAAAIVGGIAMYAMDQHAAIGGYEVIWIVTALSFLIGFLLIIPIGGADMPVVVSMLNSYSGWAAAGIGFTLSNSALIITCALVGSSGAIMS